jgi:hypothetical protein
VPPSIFLGFIGAFQLKRIHGLEKIIKIKGLMTKISKIENIPFLGIVVTNHNYIFVLSIDYLPV